MHLCAPPQLPISFANFSYISVYIRVCVICNSLRPYDPPVSANNGIKFGAKESAPCLAGAAAGFAALQNTHGLFDRSPSDIAVSLQL
jgi:hypothetical protein